MDLKASIKFILSFWETFLHSSFRRNHKEGCIRRRRIEKIHIPWRPNSFHRHTKLGGQQGKVYKHGKHRHHRQNGQRFWLGRKWREWRKQGPMSRHDERHWASTRNWQRGAWLGRRQTWWRVEGLRLDLLAIQRLWPSTFDKSSWWSLFFDPFFHLNDEKRRERHHHQRERHVKKYFLDLPTEIFVVVLSARALKSSKIFLIRVAPVHATSMSQLNCFKSCLLRDGSGGKVVSMSHLKILISWRQRFSKIFCDFL